ncbi:MAG: peptidoglycan-binding domain-containing protein [Planctomycetota bacterium]
MSPDPNPAGDAARQSTPGAGGSDGFSERLQEQLQQSQRVEAPPRGQAATEQSTESQESEQQRQAAAEDSGPVGQGERVVRQGECITSIARDTGHFWETIWEDDGNSEVRAARQNPNVLRPEDRLAIPEMRRKDETVSPEMRHRFIRRGEPAMLRLRLEDEGRPRANLPYVLEIDGEQHSGTTDAEGKIDERIPGSAQRAELRVGEGEDQDIYDLQLGELDPITTNTGVQARLNHLGFNAGPVDGEIGEQTQAAIAEFQDSRQMTVTGNPDGQTRQRLRDDHGS